MAKGEFIVSAWSNSTGSYGFSFSKTDWEICFPNLIDTIYLYFPGESKPVTIKAKKDFCLKACTKIISIEISNWLREQGYASWDKNSPPQFVIQKINEKKFKIIN